MPREVIAFDKFGARLDPIFTFESQCNEGRSGVKRTGAASADSGSCESQGSECPKALALNLSLTLTPKLEILT